jgi:hypothetical protein
MSHIENRLSARSLEYSPAELATIAQKYEQDTAVILGKRDEGVNFGIVLIILIVRSKRPVTIMTRRQSQNFDKRNFNVQKIVYL